MSKAIKVKKNLEKAITIKKLIKYSFLMKQKAN